MTFLSSQHLITICPSAGAYMIPRESIGVNSKNVTLAFYLTCLLSSLVLILAEHFVVILIIAVLIPQSSNSQPTTMGENDGGAASRLSSARASGNLGTT
jgi:hypothetical protein